MHIISQQKQGVGRESQWNWGGFGVGDFSGP